MINLEARKLRMKATKYYVVRDKLYQRSFLGPLLRCFSPRAALKVMIEVHEGQCINH